MGRPPSHPPMHAGFLCNPLCDQTGSAGRDICPTSTAGCHDPRRSVRLVERSRERPPPRRPLQTDELGGDGDEPGQIGGGPAPTGDQPAPSDARNERHDRKRHFERPFGDRRGFDRPVRPPQTDDGDAPPSEVARIRQSKTGSRHTGQVMQWPPPRPRPSSEPSISMTATPARLRRALVHSLRS